MTQVELVRDFLEQADYCEQVGAPLYGVLLRAMADDWAAGGPVRQICAEWAGAPADHHVPLRLLGGLHRLVLAERAPELAPFFRTVGGESKPDGVWPLVAGVLRRHSDELRAALDVAPQTNEPGRAVPLAIGLLHAAARHRTPRIRLWEIGASAGLNLRVDHFRITGEGWQGWGWGPVDSPVDLTRTVCGPLPEPVLSMARRGVRIEQRRGCDLSPVDAGAPEGRLRLTSFVWPDQLERHRRLAGALEVASQVPAEVDAAPAGPWLARQAEQQPEPGVLTVLWHSVLRQYVADADWAEVLAELDRARRRFPLAHASFEPGGDPALGQWLLTLDGEPIGQAPAHGVPLTLS